MTAAPLDPMAFLMGSKVPSAFEKNDPVGTTVSGRVSETPTLQQQTDYDTGAPLTWDDGRPRMQLVVTVQTDKRTGPDDDGARRFYVKGEMQKAVAQAVRASGATGLEVGGVLTVTLTGTEPVTLRNGKPGNPKKLYSASYTPAAAGFLHSEPEPQAAAPVHNYSTPHAPAPAVAMPDGFDAQVWASMPPEAQAAIAALQQR